MLRSIEGTQKGATSPLMLQQICKVLFPGEGDYHIRLAELLGLKTKIVKGWFAGKTKTMNRHHEVFATLENILLQREQELHEMRLSLHRWRTEE
jgi:hypothetical protein